MSSIPKSDFRYQQRKVKGFSFLMFEDMNLGHMSLTNDIERAIEFVCKLENLNPVEHYIIYKDSEGNWDAYDFATRDFKILKCKHWLEAANKIINQ